MSAILGASEAAPDLLSYARGRRFRTVLADPPWRFQNSTGKVAPEHRRLSRYGTLALEDIMSLPMPKLCDDVAHLYLWVPNALLPEGLAVLRAWGFGYKSNTWFGTKCARTAAPTAGEWAFIFVMSLSLFCSA